MEGCCSEGSFDGMHCYCLHFGHYNSCFSSRHQSINLYREFVRVQLFLSYLAADQGHFGHQVHCLRQRQNAKITKHLLLPRISPSSKFMDLILAKTIVIID